MVKIRVSGIVEESIVDGPGIRFVLFTQGCRHKCKGCHNPQTHSFNGGKLMEVHEIVEMIKSNPLLKGISLSGGDPFEQAEECLVLAKEVKKLGLDVLAYTGYRIEELLENEDQRKLLKEVDILIDGPFILEERTELLKFRGSENQRIINVKEYMNNI